MGDKTFGALQSEQLDSHLEWRAPVFRISTGLTVVAACLTIAGHLGGIEWLTKIYPTGARTSVATAVLFLAVAASTSLAWHGRNRPKLNRASLALAGVTVFACLGVLVVKMRGGLPDPAGGMAAPDGIAGKLDFASMFAITPYITLASVISLSISAILAARGKAASAQLLALGAQLIALPAAMGYLLASRWIYETLPPATTLGFPTVVMVVSASVALMATTGDRGIASEISSSLIGGSLARRILPVVLIAPIIIGWLRIRGEDLGLYGMGFGISILVTSLVVIGTSATLIGASWLNRVDRERTLAESESLERAARITDIFEGAAEGIVTIDSDRRITSANPRAELAFARDDLIGLGIEEVLPSGIEALGELDETASKSGFKKDLRMVGETSSGRLFPIEGSLTKRTHGSEKTFTLIFRDVSERVRAENRIRALNERLEDQIKKRTEQLNRTAGDLEAFSYSVSHDLRAPLRAMSGFARIISDDLGDDLPPETRHYLDRIQANAAQMAELIDGLLEYSKIDRVAASRRELDLRALIQEEIELIRPAIEAREVDLRINDMPSCDADPVLMRRVIANLLSNAFKFTADCDPAIIEAGYDEDSAAYFISDNGVGFDDKRADRLFEVFQRLHSRDKYPGAGIGLALTRRIIEKHGGSIWAKSRPHQGATFYFSVGGDRHSVRAEVTHTGVGA